MGYIGESQIRMDAEQYCRALKRLGLDRVDAAQLLDVSERTGTRWETGAAEIPGSVGIVLQLLLMGEITTREVARAAGAYDHRWYRHAIDTLGLSQVAAAQLLDVDPRTSRRWVLDERELPTTIGIVLQLLLRKKITPADVQRAKAKIAVAA